MGSLIILRRGSGAWPPHQSEWDLLATFPIPMLSESSLMRCAVLLGNSQTGRSIKDFGRKREIIRWRYPTGSPTEWMARPTRRRVLAGLNVCSSAGGATREGVAVLWIVELPSPGLGV